MIVRRAHQLPAETWDKLSGPLRGVNDRVWPFLCLEGAWEYDRQTRAEGAKIPKWIQRQKYWEVAERRGFVWRSPGLTPRAVPEFLKGWARERGLTVEPGPIPKGQTVHFSTHGDHRLAMSTSLFLLAGVDAQFDKPGVVAKSFPTFWEKWAAVRNG